MFSSLGGGRRHSRRPRLALVGFSLVLLLIFPSILSGEAQSGSNSFVKARHSAPSLFSASCRRPCSPSTPEDEVTMWLSVSFRVCFLDSTIFMALSPCETKGHGPLQITGGRSVKLSLSNSSRDRSCNLLSNLVSCCSYERSLRGLNCTAGNNGRVTDTGVIISSLPGFLCCNVLPIRFWICCCDATFSRVVLNAETFSIIYYPEVSGVRRTTCLLGRNEHLTADDIRMVLMLAATGYISKTLAIGMGLRPNRDYNLGLLGYYSGYVALVFGLGCIVHLLSLNPYEPYMVGFFMFFIVIFSVRLTVLVSVGLKIRSTEHIRNCN